MPVRLSTSLLSVDAAKIHKVGGGKATREFELAAMEPGNLACSATFACRVVRRSRTVGQRGLDVSEVDRLESHIERPPTSRSTREKIQLPSKEAKRNQLLVDVTPRPSSPKPASTASYLALQHQHQSAESCSTTATEGDDSDVVPSMGSDTSVSSSGVLPPKPALLKSPSIICGFSPSYISSSYRSNPKLTPEASMMAKTVNNQKPSAARRKGGVFINHVDSAHEDEDEEVSETAIEEFGRYFRGTIDSKRKRKASAGAVYSLSSDAWRAHSRQTADEDDENLTMRGPDVPRSKPIIMKAILQPIFAHSPRTARRNMLAMELTESLRRHLFATANAAAKRRHGLRRGQSPRVSRNQRYGQRTEAGSEHQGLLEKRLLEQLGSITQKGDKIGLGAKPVHETERIIVHTSRANHQLSGFHLKT
ncbi:Protein of unknown function (DUF3295) domain containing protein [Elaphomyces granulatus]